MKLNLKLTAQYVYNLLPLAPTSPISPFGPMGPGIPCVPGGPGGPNYTIIIKKKITYSTRTTTYIEVA